MSTFDKSIAKHFNQTFFEQYTMLSMNKLKAWGAKYRTEIAVGVVVLIFLLLKDILNTALHN
jgi:hypothetical protein